MEFEQFDNRIYPAGDRFVADSLETTSTPEGSGPDIVVSVGATVALIVASAGQ